MSFSKAKLKRFNDVNVACISPAASSKTISTSSNDLLSSSSNSNGGNATTVTVTSSTQPERKDQIEKFFKDAVRFATSSKETKDFVLSKDGCVPSNKEDKKPKGLRLFRTPSLPHRLRFRQSSDVAVSSNPLQSVVTTPVKESSKSAGKTLKGKEALQLELRRKNELIDSYNSQIDVLKRHIDQLKEAEAKLREDYGQLSTKTDTMIYTLQFEISGHKNLNDNLVDNCAKLESELNSLTTKHLAEVEGLRAMSEQLKVRNLHLQQDVQTHKLMESQNQKQLEEVQEELTTVRLKLADENEEKQRNFELIENLKNTNDALLADVSELKKQIELDVQEMKTIQNEMECLKKERNTLKNDLASKCELIRALQEEMRDKNCEIDAHCDTIRQLCQEKTKLTEKEKLIESAEEKVRTAEMDASQKIQKLESDLETALEREKAYWRSELEKRKKMAENEVIKVELEKQDVMILLESTNEMLRDRDEKILKYEKEICNGIDYYVHLTDTLQKQVVTLKQDMAKIISEKYNYQLTLSNTRSTVNILMERLKKSDADVEQLKSEVESIQLAKGTIEQSYFTLQKELEVSRRQKKEAEAALESLLKSSQKLQEEVSKKENMYQEILSTEEDTLDKFNKIASSFQKRVDDGAEQYLELYNELKCKDEAREIYMHDMKKALDEFATVLQLAQLELDNKERILTNIREECEKLKLDNMTLKSKIEETVASAVGGKKENSTDLEKIEDLLIDSELRAECEKITSWLLSSSATGKNICNESANEMNDLLKPGTPNTTGNKSRICTTPVRVCGTTPRTPKSNTPALRTTPKKTALFVGKENVCSPQKPVLKPRNM